MFICFNLLGSVKDCEAAMKKNKSASSLKIPDKRAKTLAEAMTKQELVKENSELSQMNEKLTKEVSERNQKNEELSEMNEMLAKENSELNQTNERLAKEVSDLREAIAILEEEKESSEQPEESETIVAASSSEFNTIRELLEKIDNRFEVSSWKNHLTNLNFNLKFCF